VRVEDRIVLRFAHGASPLLLDLGCPTRPGVVDVFAAHRHPFLADAQRLHAVRACHTHLLALKVDGF